VPIGDFVFGDSKCQIKRRSDFVKKRNTIMIAVASTLLLGIIGLGAVGCPTSDTTGVTLAGVNAEVGALKTWQGEAVISLQARPTRDETNSLIAAAVANVNAPSLSGYVTASQYNALLARVEALEAQLGGTDASDVDPEDAVDCDATFNNTYTFAHALTAAAGPYHTQDVIVNIKLKLENELAVDVEDVVIDATIVLYPDVSSALTINSGQFIGDIDWQPVYTLSWQNWESWSDIELDASDSDSYILTYKVNVTNGGAVDITSLIVTAHFGCTDYDIR
jgi:hypothetical protein